MNVTQGVGRLLAVAMALLSSQTLTDTLFALLYSGFYADYSKRDICRGLTCAYMYLCDHVALSYAS